VPVRERILAAIGRLSTERPRLVLVVVAILACVSAAALPGIEVVSSRFALIDEGGRVESALMRYAGHGDLVAVIEAEDESAGRAAADAVAMRLASLEGASTVWHRFDPEILAGRELDLLDPQSLEALAEAARPGAPRDLDTLVTSTLVGLGAEDDGVTLDTLEEETPLADVAGLRALADRLDTLAAAGDGRWSLFEGFDEAGYACSSDRRSRYVFVAPASSTDRYDDVLPLVCGARRAADDVAGEVSGVEIRLTGYPALSVDEVDAIRDGAFLPGALSALLVVALFAFGFRSRAGILIAGIPLAAGMLIAFGMIALSVGRLNLLTQAAAPVFVGLGIDFSVHLVAAYERARADASPHAAAVDAAMRGAGRGIVTGGLTTAGAFFALTLSGNRAAAELGWIAGTGLVIVMLTILFTTPALWTLGERYGQAWVRIGVRGPGSLARRVAQLTSSRPRACLAVATLLTLVAGLGIARLGFEGDVEALMPEEAESVVAARALSRGGVFSSERMISEQPDLASLAATSERMAALPSVGHVESLLTFVPGDVTAARALVGVSRSPWPAIHPEEQHRPPIRERLDRLAREAGISSTELRNVGSPALADGLTRVAEASSGAASRLAASDDPLADVARFDAGFDRDVGLARELFERADPGLPPLGIEDLPRSLRRRLVRDDAGQTRYALHVRPAGRIFEDGLLDAFVSETRGVDPDVVGYPAQLHAFIQSSEAGLLRASAVAAAVVLLILAFDYRRPRDVALALLPVAIGVAWLLGFMGWLGVDANPANVAALPLILGVGVDDGVHLVHRRRQADSTSASVRDLSPALLLTTATTAASFGTLILAAHRGMQSFGLVMMVGAAACLLATLFVLPALMRLVHGR